MLVVESSCVTLLQNTGIGQLCTAPQLAPRRALGGGRNRAVELPPPAAAEHAEYGEQKRCAATGRSPSAQSPACCVAHLLTRLIFVAATRLHLEQSAVRPCPLLGFAKQPERGICSSYSTPHVPVPRYLQHRREGSEGQHWLFVLLRIVLSSRPVFLQQRASLHATRSLSPSPQKISLRTPAASDFQGRNLGRSDHSAAQRGTWCAWRSGMCLSPWRCALSTLWAASKGGTGQEV